MSAAEIGAFIAVPQEDKVQGSSVCTVRGPLPYPMGPPGPPATVTLGWLDLSCFLCRGLSICSAGDSSIFLKKFAQALRYRMCFEDLGLLNTFPCLHDQKLVRLPPVILFSTNCAPPLCVFSGSDPPIAVFQKETVAVQAQVRHCDTSLSSDGRDDTPQVVRTSEHDLLHSAHLFDLVLFYQVERLFYPVEGLL